MRSGWNGKGKARQNIRQGRKRLEEEWMEWQEVRGGVWMEWQEVRGGVDGMARHKTGDEEVRRVVNGMARARQGTRQGRKRLDEEWMEWQGQGKAKYKTGEEEVRRGVDGMARG